MCLAFLFHMPLSFEKKLTNASWEQTWQAPHHRKDILGCVCSFGLIQFNNFKDVCVELCFVENVSIVKCFCDVRWVRVLSINLDWASLSLIAHSPSSIECVYFHLLFTFSRWFSCGQFGMRERERLRKKARLLNDATNGSMMMITTGYDVILITISSPPGGAQDQTDACPESHSDCICHFFITLSFNLLSYPPCLSHRTLAPLWSFEYICVTTRVS